MTIWHVGANDFRACSTSRPDRVGQLGIYQRDSGRLMRFYPRTGRFGGADLMHLKTLAFQHLAKRPAKEFVCIHDQDDRRLFETLVRTLLTSGHCPTAIAKFLPPRGYAFLCAEPERPLGIVGYRRDGGVLVRGLSHLLREIPRRSAIL